METNDILDFLNSINNVYTYVYVAEDSFRLWPFKPQMQDNNHYETTCSTEIKVKCFKPLQALVDAEEYALVEGLYSMKNLKKLVEYGY